MAACGHGRIALAHQNEWANGQDQWGKAEAAYKRAIELDPNVAMYYYNLGNLYTKWGHPQQALAALHKAKTLAPRAIWRCAKIWATPCANSISIQRL